MFTTPDTRTDLFLRTGFWEASTRLGCGLVLSLGTLTHTATAAPFPSPQSNRADLMGPAHVSEPIRPSRSHTSDAPATEFRALQPVRHPFVAQWQEATAREMSGPGASPWYRDTATHLDVRWRIAELSPETIQIEQNVRDRAVDMALAGALTGWNMTISRTLRRTPELVPVQTAIQSALTPGFQLQKSSSGSTRVSAQAPGTRNQQAALAAINQGPTSRPTSSPVDPPSSIRTGSAITLLRMPDSSDIQAGADADTPLSPGLSSWVDVREVLVDAARIQTRLSTPQKARRFRPEVRWTAVVRQGLMPDWALIADLQGTPNAVRPTRNGIALEHQLARMGLPAWAVRLSAGQELRSDLESELQESRLMLTVRTNLGWYLPQDVNRWPLGQRPGTSSPMATDILPGEPSTALPLAQSYKDHSSSPVAPADGIADSQHGSTADH